MQSNFLFTILLIVMNFTVFNNCSAFGKDPFGAHQEKIQKSPNFDSTKEQFVNRRPNILDEMREKQNMLSLTWKFFFGGSDYKTPTEKLPEVKPDMVEFLKPSDGIKFIWFGHSSFLVNIDGKILLFDPVFSESAAPFSFIVKRFQDAVIKLEELPNIDYIIISHDHYDHLDMETIQFFAEKQTKFITPLGVTSHIKDWGIAEDRLMELDWWESLNIGGVEIVCTPAQHFSGRKCSNGNKTLWGSWVIIGKSERFYFSGDSGYDVHFKNIGDKYGPFEIAFIENGQYNELWREVHVLPEETGQAFLDLKGKRLVPVHWGMFDLSLHSWYEPIEELEKQAELKNINLLTPKFGQIVYTKRDNIFERWWKAFLSN
ncbi:MBL fold metallo-hydrolase [Leptospira sp. GIMC2001]|uniref:MBL fold metallo-hydrolase n=1 Tax=Leptospira sp. GIMC2001 TaxID=1513297 RepID=UPI00234B22C4|nr:MBL fold metallo-hydrolase [Leptospira sp. GIMC2001]WCL48591.1 MBL fold metallo-hydrolase [Leptospira sp. GIMC2001]